MGSGSSSTKDNNNENVTIPSYSRQLYQHLRTHLEASVASFPNDIIHIITDYSYVSSIIILGTASGDENATRTWIYNPLINTKWQPFIATPIPFQYGVAYIDHTNATLICYHNRGIQFNNGVTVSGLTECYHLDISPLVMSSSTHFICRTGNDHNVMKTEWVCRSRELIDLTNDNIDDIRTSNPNPTSYVIDSEWQSFTSSSHHRYRPSSSLIPSSLPSLLPNRLLNIAEYNTMKDTIPTSSNRPRCDSNTNRTGRRRSSNNIATVAQWMTSRREFSRYDGIIIHVDQSVLVEHSSSSLSRSGGYGLVFVTGGCRDDIADDPGSEIFYPIPNHNNNNSDHVADPTHGNSVMVSNNPSGSWIKLENGNMPHSRLKGSGVVIPQLAMIFIIGGIKSHTHNEEDRMECIIDRFDLRSMTWVATPTPSNWSLPSEIAKLTTGCSVHYINGYGIYIIGGRETSTPLISDPVSLCWRLDIDNDGDDATWQAAPPLPHPLSSMITIAC
jgi:hypothetical protein